MNEFNQDFIHILSILALLKIYFIFLLCFCRKSRFLLGKLFVEPCYLLHLAPTIGIRAYFLRDLLYKFMASSSFSPAAPQVFNGEGYHIWVVKMKTYLQAFDLWEVVNSDVEPAPLRANPIVAQIRQHADERTKRYKAMSCIQNCVSDIIFTRIVTGPF